MLLCAKDPSFGRGSAKVVGEAPQVLSRGFPRAETKASSLTSKVLTSPSAGLQVVRKCAHYCVLRTISAIKNQEIQERRSGVNQGYGQESEKRLTEHLGDLRAISSVIRQGPIQVLRGLMGSLL